MTVISIIAAVLLAVSAALAVTAHHYIQNRVITTGKVDDLIVSRGSKGGSSYKIVATFRDRTGHEHTYKSSFSTSHPGYKIGAPIRICYNESAPADCGIYSFGYRFGAAWIVGVIALALFAIATGFRRGPAIMDAIYLSKPGMMELR